jgi:hypothetical protein
VGKCDSSTSGVSGTGCSKSADPYHSCGKYQLVPCVWGGFRCLRELGGSFFLVYTHPYSGLSSNPQSAADGSGVPCGRRVWRTQSCLAHERLNGLQASIVQTGVDALNGRIGGEQAVPQLARLITSVGRQRWVRRTTSGGPDIGRVSASQMINKPSGAELDNVFASALRSVSK